MVAKVLIDIAAALLPMGNLNLLVCLESMWAVIVKVAPQR